MEYAISISSSKGVLIQLKNSENYKNLFEYSIYVKLNFCSTIYVTEISLFYVILLRIPSFCPLIQIKGCAS